MVVRALRDAERRARFHRRGLAANKCRPASCSGPRPENGCRHICRSRSSAWWPARSAPRRGRPAEFGRSPAETRTARTAEAAAPPRRCEARRNRAAAESPRAGASDCTRVIGGRAHRPTYSRQMGRACSADNKDDGGLMSCARLLQPHHDAVADAAGSPSPSAAQNPVRRAERTKRAPPHRRRQRHAIDHDGQRRPAAGNLERHGIRRGAAAKLQPCAIGREHDARGAAHLARRPRRAGSAATAAAACWSLRR